MLSVKAFQETCMNSTNPSPKQTHSPKRLLIVDDIPQVRQDLRQLLELTGLFEIVAEAGNGQEAVQQVETFTPEAVVMDLEMPGMDGYEATRLVKAQYPAIRVIVLSAYAGPDEVRRARTAGADGFVMKGDRYEVLVDAILGKNSYPNLFVSKKGQES
jgi:DNA-binding NarL/FixJ family response regulator